MADRDRCCRDRDRHTHVFEKPDLIMTDQEIEQRFTYHAPKNDQQIRYQQIREHAKRFAYLIKLVTPESREQTRAFNALDECVMLANAAIARNE